MTVERLVAGWAVRCKNAGHALMLTARQVQYLGYLHRTTPSGKVVADGTGYVVLLPMGDWRVVVRENGTGAFVSA